MKVFGYPSSIRLDQLTSIAVCKQTWRKEAPGGRRPDRRLGKSSAG